VPPAGGEQTPGELLRLVTLLCAANHGGEMAQGREGVRDLCGQDSTVGRRLEDSSPPPLHHLRQATQPNPPQVCRLPVTSSDLPLPMRVGSRGRRRGGATPARWRDRRRRQPITAPSTRDASRASHPEPGRPPPPCCAPASFSSPREAGAALPPSSSRTPSSPPHTGKQGERGLGDFCTTGSI
jgi:hypothetical protein